MTDSEAVKLVARAAAALADSGVIHTPPTTREVQLATLNEVLYAVERPSLNNLGTSMEWERLLRPARACIAGLSDAGLEALMDSLAILANEVSRAVNERGL